MEAILPKFLAPCVERKSPDTFCFTATLQISRSTKLLTNDTLKSKTNQQTSTQYTINLSNKHLTFEHFRTPFTKGSPAHPTTKFVHTHPQTAHNNNPPTSPHHPLYNTPQPISTYTKNPPSKLPTPNQYSQQHPTIHATNEHYTTHENNSCT
ncbi:MAG: protein regulator of cytokinesis family protein [Candidatus Bathyarchaeota archaeon]|nr:protein regulator of cytokinesis family protein [Candidatus Termiticorpusculum sp.]